LKTPNITEPHSSSRLIHFFAIALLLAFTWVSRQHFIPEIGNYGDDTHKWLHAKMLNGEIPMEQWSWDHHTARTAIMAVVGICQACTGSHPIHYFIPALIACLGIACCLYCIGCLLASPLAGLAAGLALLLWTPDMFYQLMPSPFMSWAYLGALACLLAAIRECTSSPSCSKSSRTVTLLVISASIFHFIAYLCWIGALFFLPVFALLIWVHMGRRLALTYCFLMAGLYGMETLTYAVLAGIPFGRLEIITWYHMTDMDRFHPSMADLVLRFKHLYGYPRHVILPFLAILPACLIFWKKWNPFMRALLLSSLTYLVFLTFSITSLHPLKPFLLHTQPRYAYPLYPLALLLFSYLIFLGLRSMVRAFPLVRRLTIPQTPTMLTVMSACFLTAYAGLHTQMPEGNSWKDRSEQLNAQVKNAELAAKNAMPIVQLGKGNPKGLKYYHDILLQWPWQSPECSTLPIQQLMNIHARPAWVILPPDIQCPKSEESIVSLENLYTGDLAIFVSQFPFRMSTGSIMQVGISQRAAKGRMGHFYSQRWPHALEWLLDTPDQLGDSFPIQIEASNPPSWKAQTEPGSNELPFSIGSFSIAENAPLQEPEKLFQFRLPPSTRNGDWVCIALRSHGELGNTRVEIRAPMDSNPLVSMHKISNTRSEWMLIKIPVDYLSEQPMLEFWVAEVPSESGLMISSPLWTPSANNLRGLP
jgi:hypothetical protein